MIDENKSAVEYDLIALGLRLRHLGETEDFTWGDLLAIVQWAPHTSALWISLHPKEAYEERQWVSLNMQLTAEIADSLRVANWQRAEGKKSDYPKPYPRPGVEEQKSEGTVQPEAVSQEEMAEWLGWN